MAVGSTVSLLPTSGPLTGLGVDSLLDALLGIRQPVFDIVGVESTVLDRPIEACLELFEQEGHQVVLGDSLGFGHLGQRPALGECGPKIVGGQPEKLGHVGAGAAESPPPAVSLAVESLARSPVDHLADTIVELGLELRGTIGVDPVTGNRLVDPLRCGLDKGGLQLVDRNTLIGGDVGQRHTPGERRPNLLRGQTERFGQRLDAGMVGEVPVTAPAATIDALRIHLDAGRIGRLLCGTGGLGRVARIIVGCREGHGCQHRSGGDTAYNQCAGDHETLEIGLSHEICQLLC